MPTYLALRAGLRPTAEVAAATAAGLHCYYNAIPLPLLLPLLMAFQVRAAGEVEEEEGIRREGSQRMGVYVGRGKDKEAGSRDSRHLLLLLPRCFAQDRDIGRDSPRQRQVGSLQHARQDAQRMLQRPNSLRRSLALALAPQSNQRLNRGCWHHYHCCRLLCHRHQTRRHSHLMCRH